MWRAFKFPKDSEPYRLPETTERRVADPGSSDNHGLMDRLSAHPESSVAIREIRGQNGLLRWTNHEFLDDRPRREGNRQPHRRGDILGLKHLHARLGWRRLRTLVEQRRVHVTRENRTGTNAAATFLGVERLHESGETKLRNHVSGTRLRVGQASGIGIDHDD